MQEAEPRISAYFHGKAIKNKIPVSGTFELTRKCNFNCKMCYVHTTDTSGDVELTTEEWLKIAENAKNAGMLFLLLTGGEPLLRKDFKELYKELSKMGFVISINTNGSLIDSEILKLWKEYPPFRVNISLYGCSDETYKKLCGNEKFAAVYNNIKALKEAGISVRLNCSVSKYNKDDVEGVYKIAQKLGLVVKAASYMYPATRSQGSIGENQGRLSCREAAECNILIRKLTYPPEILKQSAEMLLKINTQDCPDEDSEYLGVRCRAGRSSFWLTYDGKMMPCGMMDELAVNLKETDFISAWKYILEKTGEIRLPKECSVCSYRNICNVCAAMCYTETGSFNKKPQYVCDMVKELLVGFKKEFGEKSEGESNEDK